MSLPAQVTAEGILALARQPPKDNDSRQKLYDAARELMFAVELPFDTDNRLLFGAAQTSLAAVGSNMKVFDTLASDPSKTWTIDDLARPTNADPALVHRVCRYLTSIGVITEAGTAEYQANHITIHAAIPGFQAGLERFSTGTASTFVALPAYLEENGYSQPTDVKKLPFHKALGVSSDMDYMQYVQSNPKESEGMFKFMAYHKALAPTWLDGSVPLDDFKLSEQDLQQNRVMMVDVGGGSGHQCIGLRKAFPHLRGKAVVQDVRVMIDRIDGNEAAKYDLEPMVYDFFTPQPLKGAKVYYLRTVLHDWNTENSKIILRRLRDAMAADSVVIIDEIIVPLTGASNRLMNYDFTMLAFAAAMERSQTEWEDLLASVGLRIRNIWIYDKSLHSGLIVAIPV